MQGVSGNSTVDEILRWLNNKLNELKAIEQEVNSSGTKSPSSETITEAQNIVNSAKLIISEKEKVMTEEGASDIKETIGTFNDIVDEMGEVMSKLLYSSNTNESAAMALNKIMNDNTFQRIQEIEKQILYRRFYFPGGSPKLRVAGQGQNNPNDDFEYDQSTEGTDPFDHWDPRYLKEYVTIAKQQGFHRNFIYYDGEGYKSINFSQALEILRKCLNVTTGNIESNGACDKHVVAGVIAGLLYFDKLECFVEEMGFGNASLFTNKVNVINGDLINEAIDKLANGLIKQSMSNFIKNNYGWMSNSNDLAFDAARYVKEWVALEAEYQKYKDEVWKILKSLNALELCTNNVDVTGNNITIQQEMNCVQKISDVQKKEEEEKAEGGDDDANGANGGGNGGANGRGNDESGNDDANNSTNSNANNSANNGANGNANNSANGNANNSANGDSNGSANGNANGSANGDSNGSANGNANSSANTSNTSNFYTNLVQKYGSNTVNVTVFICVIALVSIIFASVIIIRKRTAASKIQGSAKIIPTGPFINQLVP